MEYRALGQSGLKVSSVCLGAMTFGEADDKSFMHRVGADERTSFEILNAAIEAGVNFIDTADVYGQDGLSERIIGKWFAETGKRDELVLATKFRFKMHARTNGTGASRRRVMEAAEASLRRLSTDRIDLYQIHMQDVETPEEETLRALDDLVRQGKVLYIGASNYAAYRLVSSLWTSREQRLERFVSLQTQYSLVERSIEREHVPLCEQFGLGILPWSPLASGFLSGKYQKGAAPPPGARLEKWQDSYRRFDNERNWTILDAVRTVADELNATPSQVSLAWLLTRPRVASVIIGARSLEQLADNVKAAELVMAGEAADCLTDASAFDVGYPYSFMKNIQGRW